MRTPLAWRNIAAAKARSVVALCGITFAIVLIFMQLGFHAAAQTSATGIYDALDFDIVLLSPEYVFLAQPGEFPRGRLEQIRALNDVESVAPVWARLGEWRNPTSLERWNVIALGVDPTEHPFRENSINEQVHSLTVADTALADSLARPEQGHPVPGTRSELHDHRIKITGQYSIGGGFAAGATLITSRATFLQAFHASPDNINLGLVRLSPGASSEKMVEEIKNQVWPVATALTRAQIIAAEQNYWLHVKPVGIMFTSGLIVSVIAGAVILYQVLATEVQNRLREYATLKALGYPNSYVYGTVVREAFILCVLGFFPAFLIALFLYFLLRTGALVQVWMQPGRVSAVALLTVMMCLAATFLAIRKLGRADPADLF